MKDDGRTVGRSATVADRLTVCPSDRRLVRSLRRPPCQRIRQRRVHVEIQRVAEFVLLRRGVGLDAGSQVRGLVRSEARLADAAHELAERAVAEEVDTLLGEIELHLLCGRMGLPAGPQHGLVALGHLRCLLGREISLVHQFLHDLVEQVGELAFDLPVSCPIAGGLAAENPEHFG